ncbi:transcriptional repressor [Quaeritorhiza haematococci]|nr:transcriptional repressor [Quaeritorhiza haematococci]
MEASVDVPSTPTPVKGRKPRGAGASRGRKVDNSEKAATKGGKKSKPARRYYCKVEGCNKSFSTRIHLGLKPFQCPHPGCEASFSRQDNMTQHYRTHLLKLQRTEEGSFVIKIGSPTGTAGFNTVHMPPSPTSPPDESAQQ